MIRALAAIAFLLLPMQAADLVIHAGILLDGTGKQSRDQYVTVSGNRIASVSSTKPDHVDIDLPNGTLMPGWIDTHVHITWHFDENGRLADEDSKDLKETKEHAWAAIGENVRATLLGGFTTVQSLGSPQDKDVRAAIERGEFTGPRLLSSMGQLFKDSGDPEQLRAAVTNLAHQGADVIKLFATLSIRDGGGQAMSDAQLQAVCGQAKSLGLRSAVHAHTSAGAKAAVLAGCNSIEHGTYLSDDVLKLMREKGVYFDPNFLVLHNYLDKKPQFLGIGNYNEAGFAWMEKALPEVADVTRRARALKLKIVFGTDAVAGADGRNAEEFIYRVRDGHEKPMDVFISATSLAADSLRMGDRIGRIAPGYDADLVATDGNPLKDITRVRKVVFVMRDGKVFKKPE